MSINKKSILKFRDLRIDQWWEHILFKIFYIISTKHNKKGMETSIDNVHVNSVG